MDPVALEVLRLAALLVAVVRGCLAPVALQRIVAARVVSPPLVPAARGREARWQGRRFWTQPGWGLGLFLRSRWPFEPTWCVDCRCLRSASAPAKESRLIFPSSTC